MCFLDPVRLSSAFITASVRGVLGVDPRKTSYFRSMFRSEDVLRGTLGGRSALAAPLWTRSGPGVGRGLPHAGGWRAQVAAGNKKLEWWTGEARADCGVETQKRRGRRGEGVGKSSEESAGSQARGGGPIMGCGGRGVEHDWPLRDDACASCDPTGSGCQLRFPMRCWAGAMSRVWVSRQSRGSLESGGE